MRSAPSAEVQVQMPSRPERSSVCCAMGAPRALHSRCWPRRSGDRDRARVSRPEHQRPPSRCQCATSAAFRAVVCRRPSSRSNRSIVRPVHSGHRPACACDVSCGLAAWCVQLSMSLQRSPLLCRVRSVSGIPKFCDPGHGTRKGVGVQHLLGPEMPRARCECRRKPETGR